MNVLMVYAHEDPTSFGAAMHNRALSFLEKNGHHVVVSDLYASGFHAVAAKWDFVVSGGAHQNYMLEQKRASTSDDAGFAEDIKTEIAKVRTADLLIIEFPLWWSAMPAMMKGWFDKVFAMGIAWDGEHRYSSGLLRGKQVLVMTDVGDPAEAYSVNGIHGATVEQHLYPLLHSTLAHAGLDVLAPFIPCGITLARDDERQQHLDALDGYLEKMQTEPSFLYKH